ncbi:A disintegrin and metalloproteinase with thrombospondin motifs 3 isoform X1 [Procambarus clarkii]|uniref:A disintegrin and metalloproteinase with thrombospondin motifs 3 isoform X1 n=1 Tax=Procambarus clarkii TaxID=6728 RepID=UPI0037446A52
MGMVEQGGGSYQVEEVEQDEHQVEEVERGQRQARLRRSARDTLVVIYPLKTDLAQDTVLSPVMPDFDENIDSITSQTPFSTTSMSLNDSTTDNEIATAPSWRGGRVRRRTRQDSQYTVELAVFVDRELFSYVKKRYPNQKTGAKVVEIVMTLVNAVHRLYSDPSLGDVKIKMLVKRIEVLGSGDPDNARGNIFKYLKNFCKWQSKINTKSTSKGWDHALLLSGHDLWNSAPSKNTTVGLAYVGGMCSRSYSCTVNEATSLAAAYIIAHEMGHNLNMKHDGSGQATRCRRNEFIMSPVMSSGATTWSSCARDALNTFLANRGECLTSAKTRSLSHTTNHHDGKAPGKRFNADDQCHYMYGEGWRKFYSSQHPFNNVCREIWCRKGRFLKTPSAAALEGTRCGASKMCKRGRCLKAEHADKNKIRMRSSTITTKKSLKKKQNKNTKKATRNRPKKLKAMKRNHYGKGAQSRLQNTSGLDTPEKRGKLKKTKQVAAAKGDKDKRKNRSRVLKPRVIRIKQKKKTNRKKPKKFRRIETPTHIVIKERMRYVEGKGWKIKIIRIKKTKRMIEESKRNKINRKIKCNNIPKCKKGNFKIKRKKTKKKPSRNVRKMSSVPIKGATMSLGRCKPKRIKHVPGKGWWVRIRRNCIRPAKTRTI